MNRGKFRPIAGVAGLALVLSALAPSTASAQDNPARPGGFSPSEAVGRMILPAGFHAEIVASEPMIRQPVAACFDERGRLWVVEYIQYPEPEGLKPVSVDQYLRTEYDRVPEPPPTGPKGKDRILILEDTDGDGRMDKETVFVEELNLASAVAVGHGGVFIAQTPYLLFYPDKNKDDRPDGGPEVLLKGFGMQDAHAVVNSMIWGPDGWLYGAQGSTVTAKIRGIEFQQGIWRYHPLTKQFELFAEGGGNTWGLDFDRQGNAFGSSNSGFITFHMVQGGYYWKGFAKHGPLHNPRTYGYFDSVDYSGPKMGGHVTPGGIIYKADQFPEEFQGEFIGGNLLANTIYWHVLEPEGSTFRAHHGGTLVDARDFWFRPIDLFTGPDGCVYVVDWYDKRASHLDPRDNWDKTNGRIYRIVYGERPKVGPFDLSKYSTDKLIALRTHKNDWWPDTARRILAERRDPEAIPKLRSLLDRDRDPVLAMRDLWALDVSGGIDANAAEALLDHPVPEVRKWAVRLLGDHHWMSGSILSALRKRAKTDDAPQVRSQLAASAQRWPVSESLTVIEALAQRAEDSKDEHIPLQIWWAVEKAVREDSSLVVERLGRSKIQSQPLVREWLLERMARALASDGSFVLLSKMIAQAPGKPELDRIASGIDKGLEGRSLARVPEELAPVLDRLGIGKDGSVARLRLAARLGSPKAYSSLADRAADRKAPASDRVAAIEVLGQIDRPEGQSRLLSVLERDGEASSVVRASLAALGTYESDAVAEAVLNRYPKLDPSLKIQAIDRLLGRKAWAGLLIDAVESGRVSSKDLTSQHAVQIARLGDPSLTERLESVWGKLPEANSEAKRQRIAEVRGILPEGDKGSAARGHEVFTQTCSGCHRLFGEGEDLGPDLTGAERRDLDFLLTSLVDPSSVIRKEYQPSTVATTDGRVLNGLIIEESDSALTLFDSNKQKTVIAREDIEEQKPSDVSVMPDGVLDPLSDMQVRDLFKYLRSSGPGK